MFEKFERYKIDIKRSAESEELLPDYIVKDLTEGDGRLVANRIIIDNPYIPITIECKRINETSTNKIVISANEKFTLNSKDYGYIESIKVINKENSNAEQYYLLVEVDCNYIVESALFKSTYSGSL